MRKHQKLRMLAKTAVNQLYHTECAPLAVTTLEDQL